MVFSWNGRLGQTAHCPVDRESRADPVYVSDLSTAEVDARGLFKTTEPATIIIVQAIFLSLISTKKEIIFVIIITLLTLFSTA